MCGPAAYCSCAFLSVQTPCVTCRAVPAVMPAVLCRSGYDGKKVDVWASGVLLFVMLLGMFPFEMEDESYVNTAGLYSIW